jgi:hypothetical protein
MMRQTFVLVGLMTLTCWLASAADIDGKWTAETQAKDGKEVTEIIVLKANNNKLIGSVQRRGAPVEISEGVINGNEVSFKVLRAEGVTQSYKGTLSGGALKLTMDGSRGNHRDLVLKKTGS